MLSGLEELTLNNLYEKLPLWRSQDSQVLQKSPGLCKLELSLSEDTLFRVRLGREGYINSSIGYATNDEGAHVQVPFAKDAPEHLVAGDEGTPEGLVVHLPENRDGDGFELEELIAQTLRRPRLAKLTQLAVVPGKTETWMNAGQPGWNAGALRLMGRNPSLDCDIRSVDDSWRDLDVLDQAARGLVALYNLDSSHSDYSDVSDDSD
ncbi:hypothetical protein N657DRAFT_636706 [Parathielavia appendiculata]|uniref:Uncharacterized protein n=1 Tax=Parathielavia appendiculata TaxID=2587402 RepID=A0AAN6YZR4_9PEZI|nr:hypothetical protein N657DRAFT_636706 [Parathielavia appendiculata]